MISTKFTMHHIGALKNSPILIQTKNCTWYMYFEDSRVPYLIKPNQFLFTIMINMTKWIARSSQPSIACAGSVSNHQIRIMCVVSGEISTFAIIAFRAIQCCRSVILKIFGSCIAICFSIIKLHGGYMTFVPEINVKKNQNESLFCDNGFMTMHKIWTVLETGIYCLGLVSNFMILLKVSLDGC